MSEADREKWNGRYREQTIGQEQPAEILLELESWVPNAGKALDVAGGKGRNALWLAQRGLNVTLADISSEGLRLARQSAEQAAVSFETLEIDFENEPFPDGPWDLIFGSYFLQRGLFQEFSGALAPGGLLIYCQPTKTNLQRHAKPPADYLLDDGELRTLVGDLEIAFYQEQWTGAGRYEAWVVAIQGN